MTPVAGRHPPLAGCRIIVSVDAKLEDAARRGVDDGRSGGLIAVLSEAGAAVLRVTVPRGEARTSAGLRSVVQRAARGGIDAVLFLSPAVSWLETAESVGALEAIRRRADSRRLLLGALHREDADRLRVARLPVLYPEGSSVAALAEGVVAHYDGGVPALVTDAGRLEVRSGGVVVDERFIPLSRGAAGVMETLFLAGGRVLSRAELGRGSSGAVRSGRAVEVAVARLRESLDGIDLVQTVVKRGYRLAVTER